MFVIVRFLGVYMIYVIIILFIGIILLMFIDFVLCDIFVY